MKVFHDNEHRVFGTVAITKRNQDTFGRDMEEMISQKLTFLEAIRDSEFTIMAKQRLKVMERDIFEQLDLPVGDLLKWLPRCWTRTA